MSPGGPHFASLLLGLVLSGCTATAEPAGGLPNGAPPPGFAWINSATFQMGCTDRQADCDVNETEHTVTLTGDYLLALTEVTQGQLFELLGGNPSFFADCGSECPVENATWYNAVAYVNALSAAEGFEACYSCTGSGAATVCTVDDPYACAGYRLPTEAEWENAARCGEDLLYAGSDSINDVAWTTNNSEGTPHPVGQLTPNRCGLVDMSGNVWEWSGDGYQEDLGPAPATDPVGDSASLSRVLRGGSWSDVPADQRVAFRHGDDPAMRYYHLGFRVARTAP